MAVRMNVLLFLVCLLISATVIFIVYRADRREIANLADESILYWESVCQRYDEYVNSLENSGVNDVLDDNVYKVTLEENLIKNSFQKNPRIIITDGVNVLAGNNDLMSKGSAVSDSPIQDAGSKRWENGDLIRLKYDGETWYGKRDVYGKYYIYIFYSSKEVFDNMGMVIVILIAVYAVACLVLKSFHHNNEKRHLAKEHEQLDTIQAIGSLFVTTSILHLDTEQLEGIRLTPRMQEVVDQTTELKHVTELFAERIIAPKDKQRYIDFMDCDTLDERLKDKENLTGMFQDNAGTWFSLYLIPMKRDQFGCLTQVLFASRNINDYMQKEEKYQEELKKAARDAKIANEVKSSFLRRMSHDIRTPMNGIRGMAALAQKSMSELENASECMQKIITSVDQLQSLLDDILRMSKLESGERLFENKSFDIYQMLDDIKAVATQRATESGLMFSMDVSGMQYQHVIGSPLHIRQIMQNILSNAVHFNRPGGMVKLVCKETLQSEHQILFTAYCSDTGISISKEFEPHIFEPFAQEANTARTHFSGTGLGLSVTKEVVQQLGGTISFVSQKGIGTTFTVTIPLELDTAYVKNDGVQQADMEGVTDENGTGETASKPLEDVHILVAEDNEINMEIAECLLQDQGASVTKAYNGKEAVEIFENSAPKAFDIILMDIMMPEMDGLEAARCIRHLHREDAEKIPIFALTANAFLDDIKQSKLAGMNEHLLKPFKIDEVTAMIRQYC